MEKDTSIKTACLVMGLCGFVGLLIFGLEGLIRGIMFGFLATTVVFISQEATKDK
ncbi:MAG: hypothetical protein KBF62_02330 [Candidatus Pacebacteria bacterium]|jgi:hypothetical protein|nr:hypothetical protein [Candidatus Paceibacterota bacterium]MBP9058454.1 hypothetical protein [Candidatus Paceibacterota bacterium]MBP9770440.1 hypothetical protein [Candidatus Paceibacterota bacterium]